MKITPPFSRALTIAPTASSEIRRRDRSKSTTVERPNFALDASSGCVIPTKARAARHCAGVILPTFSVDISVANPYQHKMLK
jgi:hypothetical protein